MRPSCLSAVAALLLALPALAQAPLQVSCPSDVAVECDGMGNVLERAAWLDQFAPVAGCAPYAEMLSVRPALPEGTVTYEEFCDVSGFTFNGSAAAIGHPIVSSTRCVLRLTDGFAHVSSIFLTNPVMLGPEGSFSTSFEFRIHRPAGSVDTDGVQGADGLVFVLQAVANTALGSGAGGLGYEGMADSVGVEFDTWNDGVQDDFDGNHAGIDAGGVVDSLQQAPVSPAFNDGSAWFAWVDHDGATDLLEVRVSQGSVRPLLPTVSAVIDVPAVLGTTDVFIGFTSATRAAAANTHDIRSWVFRDTYAPVGCGSTTSETATYLVSDSCGDSATCRRTFTVEDTTPPDLDLAAIAPCFESEADALAAALAGAVATDACSSPPRLSVTSAMSSGCGAVITVSALDDCGNVASQQRSVLIDADAPVIGAPSSTCLWPPSHGYACFTGDEIAPAVSDGCSGPITWRITGCASDQPDDDLGDGHFTQDCVVTADGICVRAERQGGKREGRTYTVFGVAADACGNESAPAAVAIIHVPHDQPRGDCRKPGRR